MAGTASALSSGEQGHPSPGQAALPWASGWRPQLWPVGDHGPIGPELSVAGRAVLTPLWSALVRSSPAFYLRVCRVPGAGAAWSLSSQSFCSHEWIGECTDSPVWPGGQVTSEEN